MKVFLQEHGNKIPGLKLVLNHTCAVQIAKKK